MRITEEPSLVAQISSTGSDGTITCIFQVFENSPAIVTRVIADLRNFPEVDESQSVMEDMLLSVKGIELLSPTFLDRTDKNHGPLVIEDSYKFNEDKTISTRGNVFIFTNPKASAGFILIKHAPLPNSRPAPVSSDIKWDCKANRLRMYGHGIDSINGKGYQYAVITFSGGKGGRIAALQKYYRLLRRYDPYRDGMLQSNTWGDRSRDGRLGESFMLLEIESAAQLGIDVVQIDDGWQKGASKNSVTKGGIWEGFWEKDTGFWTANPDRFPNGLDPIVTAAKRHRMKIGLWYAPDSSNNMANWKKDAERVLEIHRDHGIDYFKFDAIEVASMQARKNVYDFLERVIEESDGKIAIDMDITAQSRLGYFGSPFTGPLYVENRYTDWTNYYPHRTLRNFWLLSQYTDPVCLRMEFLNNERNWQKYGTDPLAPAKYRPAYLFASVMFASPLAFFENSGLSDDYVASVKPLIKVWKENRKDIYSGSIMAIGDQPSGKSWTGFISVSPDKSKVYILVFREINMLDKWTSVLDADLAGAYKIRKLYGNGDVALNGKVLNAIIPQQKDFIFAVAEK